MKDHLQISSMFIVKIRMIRFCLYETQITNANIVLKPGYIMCLPVIGGDTLEGAVATREGRINNKCYAGYGRKQSEAIVHGRDRAECEVIPYQEAHI